MNTERKKGNTLLINCAVFLATAAWLTYVAIQYLPTTQDWANTSIIEGLYERVSTSKTRSGSYNTKIAGRDISCDASAFMAGGNCPSLLEGKMVRATMVRLKMWWSTEYVAISLLSLDKDLVWSSDETPSEMMRNVWYNTALTIFQVSIVITLVFAGLRNFSILLFGTKK
jgi:hypothetical protein